MRAEDVKRLLQTRPFSPLKIFMSDGTTFEITHPDMAIVTRSWITVGIEDRTGDSDLGIADREARCSLLHIVRIEDSDGRTRLTAERAA